MKIAYFDCFSGISGDMILGALVDAGLDAARLQGELGKLDLAGVEVTCESTSRKAIKATRARVRIDADGEGHDHRHDHDHEQDAAVVDRHLVLHADHGAVAHRRLPDILELLQSSGLHADDSAAATRIFRRLAQAEARVHGVAAAEDVVLHEVGAVDAVIDIVGAVAGLRLLGVDQVWASALRCGTGFVTCAHGRYPVPVPGVLALCDGIPLVPTDVESELITPTGAAIITTLATRFGAAPAFHQTAVGYGAGSRDLDQHPNLLRLRLGETALEDTAYDSDEVIELEANIDDMNPEVYGYVIDLLLNKGARDVFLTPVYMKKGRPGTLLTAVTDERHMDAVSEAILAETTTVGLRYQPKSRRLLRRRLTTASTPYGDVQVKAVTAGSRDRFAPEYEDCARLARQRGIPILQVYEAAMAAMAAMEHKESDT